MIITIKKRHQTNSRSQWLQERNDRQIILQVTGNTILISPNNQNHKPATYVLNMETKA